MQKTFFITLVTLFSCIALETYTMQNPAVQDFLRRSRSAYNVTTQDHLKNQIKAQSPMIYVTSSSEELSIDFNEFYEPSTPSEWDIDFNADLS